MESASHAGMRRRRSQVTAASGDHGHVSPVFVMSSDAMGASVRALRYHGWQDRPRGMGKRCRRADQRSANEHVYVVIAWAQAARNNRSGEISGDDHFFFVPSRHAPSPHHPVLTRHHCPQASSSFPDGQRRRFHPTGRVVVDSARKQEYRGWSDIHPASNPSPPHSVASPTLGVAAHHEQAWHGIPGRWRAIWRGGPGGERWRCAARSDGRADGSEKVSDGFEVKSRGCKGVGRSVFPSTEHVNGDVLSLFVINGGCTC
nr:hypothetical protein CFP56_07816 [Quercus suber]